MLSSECYADFDGVGCGAFFRQGAVLAPGAANRGGHRNPTCVLPHVFPEWCISFYLRFPRNITLRCARCEFSCAQFQMSCMLLYPQL